MSANMRQGGCRCGRVRFQAAGAPMLTLACHCTNCQHMTASAFSLSDGYSADKFRIVEGTTVIGGIHGSTRHHHCDYCKSWVFTQPEGMDDVVNVRSTLFDAPRTEKPFVEVHLGEALPWAHIGADHGFDRLPDVEQWPQLIQSFAARPADAAAPTQGLSQ